MKRKCGKESMWLYFSVIFNSNCAIHGIWVHWNTTWICWNGTWIFVPFEMEHDNMELYRTFLKRSPVLKDGLSIIHLVGLCVIHFDSSGHCPFEGSGCHLLLLMHSMWIFISDHCPCLPGVQSLVFHITTFFIWGLNLNVVHFVLAWSLACDTCPHGWSNKRRCREKILSRANKVVCLSGVTCAVRKKMKD